MIPRRRCIVTLLAIIILFQTLASIPIPSFSSDSGGILYTEFSYPYPTDDSWIELDHPNSNFGWHSRLYVKKCADVRRSYLKFDLSIVPADKVIVSAKLYLYCISAWPSYNLQVDVHKTEDGWNEHTITWNNAPPVGTFVSSTMVDGACKFYSWNITSYVQSEYNGDKILSVVVKFPDDDPGSPTRERRFSSKDTWKHYIRPYLEIQYGTPSFSVSISPPSVVMDVGQSQMFTSNISNGAPPYTYQWYLDNVSVPGEIYSNWTFTPTSPGFYEVYLNVTDSLSITAKSNIAYVTVNPMLTVSISPTSVVMDLGQSQTFFSSVSGGTPSYTYQWYLDDVAVSGATASTWTFTPTSPGSYEVYLNVTDNVGFTAQSNIALVIVNSVLTVSISPTSVVMDVGQSVTFTSSVSGGTPPFTYQWYLNDSLVLGATSSDWIFTPASAGFYIVYVNVTDDVGTTSKSNVVSVTVNPTLMVSIIPTTVAMDVDQSVTFTSSVSGGTPPYTYQWYLNDTLVVGATSSNWTFTPISTGFYLIYVNVTDSVGVTVKSNIASVTVNPELSVSISPISAAMNLGDSKTFSSSVSGGTQPYTYQWYLDGNPFGTGSTWVFTPTATGSYTIYLNVTDSVDVTVKSNIALVMVNPPLEVSISPTSHVMDVGQSVTFTSSVSGGTPPYTYQWYLNDVPVPSAVNPTWAFTPTSPGSYEIYLIVADSSDPTGSNPVIVIVNPPPVVSISPVSVVMDVGQSQTFNSSVSGGTPPYTYQWYLNGTPVGTNPNWTFISTSLGFYEVYVNVTDNVAVTAKSNIASVTVNPALSVSITPTSVTMNVGESQLFTSSVSGGTPPYTYQWYLNNTAIPGATASTWTFTPTSPGSYEVYVNVTDSVGVTAKSNIASVTVNSVLTVSINPTSVVMDVGQSRLFTSSVSGGTPPHTYQWYLNSTPVPGATGTTWIFISTSLGFYEVYVNVTDNVAVTAKSNIASVTVNPALSVSITPTSVTMNVGESQLFTSSVSGGTPPYTYQWYLNETAVPGATYSDWMFTPISAGFYLVYLKVTDDVSVGTNSNTASVTVIGYPKAEFTYQPLYPYVNETVIFNASTSTPNGGTISNYTWNFGDGNITTVTEPIITHVYTAEGDYNVTLTVTDSESLSDSTSQIVSVLAYLPLLYSMDYTANHLGEEFLINIVLVNVTNLYYFEFKLGYNTTLLDAINITEGSFLKSFGSTSAMMEIHDSEGYVWMNVTLLTPAPPADGSGILATIKFKVTYATVYPETVGCNLDLYDTELEDQADNPIDHVVHDGWYEFVPSPPIGAVIDIYTQKNGKGPNEPSQGFLIGEEVILYAYVTCNDEPVQYNLVAFEVRDPTGATVLYRTSNTTMSGIATVSFTIPTTGPPEQIFGIWTAFAVANVDCQIVSDTVTFDVSGRVIDCFTDAWRKKGGYTEFIGLGPNMPADAYQPQDWVILYAYVTYNGEPVQYKLVEFEIHGPPNPIFNFTMYRTAITNQSGYAKIEFRIPMPCDPYTFEESLQIIFGEWVCYQAVDLACNKVEDWLYFKVGWIVEITDIEVTPEVTKNENVTITIYFQNIALMPQYAVFTFVVYDDLGVPIGKTTLGMWVDPEPVYCTPYNDTATVMIHIPKWAFVGMGTVYANAYTNYPWLCGIPLCPEASIIFQITKS